MATKHFFKYLIDILTFFDTKEESKMVAVQKFIHFKKGKEAERAFYVQAYSFFFNSPSLRFGVSTYAIE